MIVHENTKLFLKTFPNFGTSNFGSFTSLLFEESDDGDEVEVPNSNSFIFRSSRRAHLEVQNVQRLIRPHLKSQEKAVEFEGQQALSFNLLIPLHVV